MPDTSNTNEEPISQEANLLRELQRFKQRVGDNGYSEEQKEAILGQFKEIEQLLTDSDQDESEQKVSPDRLESPRRENRKQEEPPARTAQSSRRRATVQESVGNREAEFTWISKFSAFVFLLVIVGILTSIILTIIITKSVWLAPLSLIILLGTKPFLRIVNYYYPLNRTQTGELNEEPDESSLSRALSPLSEFIKNMNGREKK